VIYLIIFYFYASFDTDGGNQGNYGIIVIGQTTDTPIAIKVPARVHGRV